MRRQKGGLGRFINHSCAPNCYVDKWVVGTKLRMGIFSGRHIQAGEELTFDYNVDRYGYISQVCGLTVERMHSLVIVKNPIASGTLVGKLRVKLNRNCLMLSKKVLPPLRFNVDV